MIVLFTDFGIHGPYIGQMKAAVLAETPNAAIVDLLHDAPAFDPRLSSCLLSAYTSTGIFPAGCVFLCVVDPGVGSNRAGLMIKADDKWYVGPDNGLFEMVMRRASQVTVWRIELPLDGVSATFHGRDVFAPVAARLASGSGAKDAGGGSLLHSGDVVRFPWPDDLMEVIYVDSYGNLVTGIRSGEISPQSHIHIENVEKQMISKAQTFSDVSPGAAFWYENSSGLIEIAVNGGHAAERLEAHAGTRIWTSVEGRVKQ